MKFIFAVLLVFSSLNAFAGLDGKWVGKLTHTDPENGSYFKKCQINLSQDENNFYLEDVEGCFASYEVMAFKKSGNNLNYKDRVFGTFTGSNLKLSMIRGSEKWGLNMDLQNDGNIMFKQSYKYARDSDNIYVQTLEGILSPLEGN